MFSILYDNNNDLIYNLTIKKSWKQMLSKELFEYSILINIYLHLLYMYHCIQQTLSFTYHYFL